MFPIQYTYTVWKNPESQDYLKIRHRFKNHNDRYDIPRNNRDLYVHVFVKKDILLNNLPPNGLYI